MISRKTLGSKIGIILRDWPHSWRGPQYLAAIKELYLLLKHQGRSVQLISFCSKSEIEVLTELFDNTENILCWIPQEISVKDFFSELSMFDIFFTARFHGAIFSALLEKPFICIDLEQKLSIIAKELGLEAFLWKHPFNIKEALIF